MRPTIGLALLPIVGYADFVGTTQQRHPLADAARRLRPALNGRRVLLVGAAADRANLKTLVRLAGARVMAAKDVGVAFSLLMGYPIDVIVAEPQLQTHDGQSFEDAVRRTGGTNGDIVFVDLPDRPTPEQVNATPLLRLVHSRPAMSRAAIRERPARRRVSTRRTG